MLSVKLSEVFEQMNLKKPSDEGSLNYELTGFSSHHLRRNLSRCRVSTPHTDCPAFYSIM